MSTNQTKRFFKRLAVTLGLAATAAIPLQSVQGQETGVSQGNLLEEIIVTARKREESLKDVPVAISVLSGDYIAEAGILDQYDLFENTVGIQYEQSRDRQGGKPSIRGVATPSQLELTQKSTAFIDGVPLLANTGSLQFIGLERIEVLRGPQSAAFGRSTFAGAINYVTRDPGDEFSSEIKLATSDLSRDILSVSLDGPITDTLGFTLDLYRDEFDGPDEWVANDGVRLGNTTSDFAAAKLKWAPTNNFDVEVRLSALRTKDGPPLEVFVSEEARDACSNMTLPNGRRYVNGEWHCDISTALPPRRNHDLTVGLTPGTVFTYTHPVTGPVDDYDIALAWSVVDPGSENNRDQITAEFNFSTDDGSALQVLTSWTDYWGGRFHDTDRGDAPFTVSARTGMPGRGSQSMGTPKFNDQLYADVRWLSPAEQPFRWLVGVSWFDFERKDDSFREWNGILLGLEDEINGGEPFQPNRRTFAQGTAIGLYSNLTWDVTDRTTLSFEARFQEDDITNINEITGDQFNNVTESFQPRLAVNHALNEDWSIYGQLSSGTNPASINVIFSDIETIASIQDAVAAGFITYDETTFRALEEEELTNLEFGIKGSALNGRLQLAAAVYVIDWKDMALNANFDWNGPWNDGTSPNAVALNNGVPWTDDETNSGPVTLNSGDGDLKGIELEATFQLNDNWSFRGAVAIQSNEYARNCDQAPVTALGFAPTFTIAEGALFDCVDVSGNTIIYTTEETAVLSATYRAPLGSTGWDWAGRLSTRYAGPMYFDVMNLLKLPPTNHVNGSVTFSNDNWEIVLFGNNLTDEDAPRDIAENARDFNIAGNDTDIRNDRFNLRIPREIGVRLVYRLSGS